MSFGKTDTQNAVYSNNVHNILSAEIYPILFQSKIENMLVIDTSRTGGKSPYPNIEDKVFVSLMDQTFAADCIIKVKQSNGLYVQYIIQERVRPEIAKNGYRTREKQDITITESYVTLDKNGREIKRSPAEFYKLSCGLFCYAYTKGKMNDDIKIIQVVMFDTFGVTTAIKERKIAYEVNRRPDYSFKNNVQYFYCVKFEDIRKTGLMRYEYSIDQGFCKYIVNSSNTEKVVIVPKASDLEVYL